MPKDAWVAIGESPDATAGVYWSTTAVNNDCLRFRFSATGGVIRAPRYSCAKTLPSRRCELATA